jgi:hypothetical protein
MSSRDGAEERAKRVNAVVRARQAVKRAEAKENGPYPPERGELNFEWKCEELGLCDLCMRIQWDTTPSCNCHKYDERF